MYLNAYEDFNALQGRNPQNADYADIQRYPAVFYHNLRGQWDLEDLGGFGKNAQFYVGVDNVLDTKPPLSLTGIGAGSVIYDFRGRTYAGFRVASDQRQLNQLGTGTHLPAPFFVRPRGESARDLLPRQRRVARPKLVEI